MAFLTCCGDMRADSAPKVIVYFTEWAVYGRNFHITNLPAAKITHVNYAFAKVDANNQVAVWDTYAATDKFYAGDCWDVGCKRGSFHQITLFKQAHPEIKFLISVGGWTGSAPFYTLAASDAGRQTFATSCANFLTQYPQFDGIDLDWERPVLGGFENLGTPQDAQNNTLLLQAIRDAIGPNKLLTVADSCSPASIAALEYPAIVNIVDWINTLTYDFHGPWNNTNGFNSPLYYNNNDSLVGFNVNDCIQGFLARGVPPSKLVMGQPMYGHSWANANSSAPFSGANGAGPGSWENGSLDYKDIAANYVTNPNYTRYWDDTAKVPWLYNATTKAWITYDDPQSMLIKGQYIASNHLAGVMFWEIDADNGDLLDAMRTGMATTVAPPVILTLAFYENHPTLLWPTGTLQSATIVTGPYAPVAGATSPFTVTTTEPQQFFRVSVP